MAGLGWLSQDSFTGRVRSFLRNFREPLPARFFLLRALDRRFGILKRFQVKLNYGLVERPFYGHGMLQAAILAKKLGHPRISCIEFGVAGGIGLVWRSRFMGSTPGRACRPHGITVICRTCGNLVTLPWMSPNYRLDSEPPN